MKYEQAKSQLRYALKNQETISTSKLNRILQSMNISKNVPVQVVKEKKGRATVIRWNGEEYVWRSKND